MPEIVWDVIWRQRWNFQRKYISKDNGETWEHVDTPWLSSLVNRANISQIGLSPDGAMANYL